MSQFELRNVRETIMVQLALEERIKHIVSVIRENAGMNDVRREPLLTHLIHDNAREAVTLSRIVALLDG